MATGFIAQQIVQLFALLVSVTFFALGIFVFVLVIKLLIKGNKALDIWLRNNDKMQ